MFRIAIACLLLFAVSDGAMAESPAERGNYLVNTIMACGNCHTPRDADTKHDVPPTAERRYRTTVRRQAMFVQIAAAAG